ncbi:MAG: sulfatase, partial [bacterium]
PKLSFVFVTLAIIAWFAAPLIGLRDKRNEVAQPASLDLMTAVLVSVWCGLVLGLSEAHYLAWKTFIVREVVPAFRYVSADSLWMAPVMDVISITVIGVLVWGLARLVRRPITLRWLVLLCAFAAIASLILVTGRLAAIGAVVLSIGAASALANVAARHQSRFVLNARRTVPWMAAAVLVIAVVVTVVPRVAERKALSRLPAAPTNAPNVIVLVLDTERAASMGLYGYSRPTTPNLAKVAERGVLFERAIAPSTWTLPSHASMFTSRYPGELGVSYFDRLNDTYPTMAEKLRDHGYMTAGFVANIVFCTPLFGLNRGFVHYEAQPVSTQMAVESGWLTRSAFRLVNPGEERSAVRKDAAQITQDFLSWQATQSKARPYLAFLNYFDAHGPYEAPASYRERFNPRLSELPILRGEESKLYKPEEIGHFVDAYDGAIAYLDAQLGVLFKELERRGELNRSVVIVTADHGEEFGEHGFMGHGNAAIFPVLHVPLLVLHPSLPAGSHVTQAVTMTDLPATVMELAGVRDHPSTAAPGRGTGIRPLRLTRLSSRCSPNTPEESPSSSETGTISPAAQRRCTTSGLTRPSRSIA